MQMERRYRELYEEAQRLKSQGRDQDAAVLEVEAAALMEEARSRIQRGGESPESAEALLFLAEREWLVQGDTPEVQAKLESALAIRETCFGAEDERTAEALAKLADLHFLSGRWGEAEPLYRRALAAYEARKAFGTPLYSQCQGGLAQALSALGRTEDADPHFAAAITATEGGPESRRPLYFLYIYRAEGLEKLGRREAAEVLRQKALQLLPKTNPGEQGFHV